MKKFLKHKMKILFLISAFLFIALTAEECDMDPEAMSTVTVSNNTCNYLWVSVHSPAGSTKNFVSPDTKMIAIIGEPGAEFTVVARISDTYLNSVKQQRDQMVAHLAAMKEQYEKTDPEKYLSSIRVFSEDLKGLNARLAELAELSKPVSCSSAGNSLNTYASVNGSCDSLAISVSCP